MTPKSTNTQRAQRLPAPVPGVISKEIPLALLPIYFAAHQIEAMSPVEVSKLEQATGQYKPAGVVLVKRVDTDANPDPGAKES